MLTEWEKGQDLILINDYIAEIAHDFRKNGHCDLADKLDIIRAPIGDLFNKNNDHCFGVFDSSSLKKKKNCETK